MRKLSVKIFITLACALVIMLLAVCLGSVTVSVRDTAAILAHKLLGRPLPERITGTAVSIIWTIRFPRVLLAFLVGAALGASGTVMQSVLKNPLASSYTLGVSSGASLGAFVVMITGFSVLGSLTLPAAGLLCGMATVVLAVVLAARVDKGMKNNTIILTGMVFSLFVNAVLSLLSALYRESVERLYLWQMGSFSLKDMSYVAILFPILCVGLVLLMAQSRELDLLTFGEEQAMAMGVDTRRSKWLLLLTAAALTGSAVSLVGVIGFIDLIAPHLTRRLFGAKHGVTLPMSALIAGAFMALCDLVARTVVSPSEIPVGAVSALIGAPFFAYVYFRRGKETRHA